LWKLNIIPPANALNGATIISPKLPQIESGQCQQDTQAKPKSNDKISLYAAFWNLIDLLLLRMIVVRCHYAI